MLTVYLLRHGETLWNAENNRYCGRSDIPLTPKGIRQAETVREQLLGLDFDEVISSPLQRAFQTACIASGREARKDDRLIEVDFGRWEGKTRETFIAENQMLWTNWAHDPLNNRAGGTGETGAEVISRVDQFFSELVRSYPNGQVLVVAHNGVNRLYLAHKLGMPLKNYRQIIQQNATVSRFSLDEHGILSLELLNSKLK